MKTGRELAAVAVLLGGLLPGTTRLALAREAQPVASVVRKAETVDRRPTIAVLYFDYLGSDESFSVLRKGLAQMLTTDLAGHERVRVVERAHLQELLDELKLSRRVHFDAQTAGRIGRLLGARYLVLGNYLDYRGTLRVNADLVDVETGVHTTGASASGKPDDFLTLEQSLSEALARAIAARIPDASAEPVERSAAPQKVARLKPPAKLPAHLAVRYGKAMEAMDRGDKGTARTELQRVLREQPDFALAAQDLDRLLR